MDADLSTCLEKLEIFPPDGLEQAGITSLALVKCLRDDEIRHVFDSVKTETGSGFSFILVRRVQNLSYYLKHLDRVQRKFQLENVTLQLLEEMKVMKDFEESKLPKVTPPFYFTSELQILAYLSQSYGSNGVPLMYVVREVEQPDPVATYRNVYDEMIARSPLKGFHFERDNETVWSILFSAFNGTAHKKHFDKYVVPHESPFFSIANKNGRAVFLSLKAAGSLQRC